MTTHDQFKRLSKTKKEFQHQKRNINIKINIDTYDIHNTLYSNANSVETITQQQSEKHIEFYLFRNETRCELERDSNLNI